MKTTQHKRVMSSTKRNHRDEDLVTSLAAHLFDNQKHLVGESQDKWEQYAREWLESWSPGLTSKKSFMESLRTSIMKTRTPWQGG